MYVLEGTEGGDILFVVSQVKINGHVCCEEEEEELGGIGWGENEAEIGTLENGISSPSPLTPRQ